LAPDFFAVNLIYKKYNIKTIITLYKMSQRVEYTESNRPLSNALLCHQLAVWILLCPPDKFENELLLSILSAYFKKTKLYNQRKDESLSNKQYSILYNLHSKWRVSNCFEFENLKFQCILCKDWSVSIRSASGQLCPEVYFETKMAGVLTKDEFVELHGSLCKYAANLLPSQDEDFL